MSASRPRPSCRPVTEEAAARRAEMPDVVVRGHIVVPPEQERYVPYVNPVVSWMIDFRNERGLSQNTLAKALRLRQSFISMVEAGVREPTFDLLGRFTVAFPDLDPALMLIAVGEYIRFRGEHAFLSDAAKYVADMGAEDKKGPPAMVHQGPDLAASHTGGTDA